MFRLKESGEILRFDDGWGLTESYPESFRTRVAEKTANSGKGKAKKKSPGKTSKNKKLAPSAKAAGSAPQKTKAVGLAQQILNLYEGFGITILATESAKALNIDVRTINLAFGRLAAKGKVKKTEGGGYMLTDIASVRQMPKIKAS